MNFRQIALSVVVLSSTCVDAFAPQPSFNTRSVVSLNVGGGELTAEAIMEQVSQFYR
jgi:hypothetical protein